MKEFNDDGKEIHKRQSVIKLYSTTFDLTNLKHHTSNVTKEVIIWADTVYMSEPLKITYNLTIRARKTYINRALTMKMSLSHFKSETNYLVHEKQFETNNGLLVRQRKYGFVDILDASPSLSRCSGKIFPSQENI